jgi:peptidoglycan pentaglycine glycine transferase (the first glycine)
MSSNSLWNNSISRLPGAHILQTSQWGNIKERYGWRMEQKNWCNGQEIHSAAMMLYRSQKLAGIGPRIAMTYVPRGPIMDWGHKRTVVNTLQAIEAEARENACMFAKIDPEVFLGTGIPGTETEKNDPVGKAVIGILKKRGWVYSPGQIQFKNTVWLDLSQGETELLAAMKQKTRYNIRLAEKKGVTMRIATTEDLGIFYRMYAETSIRDGFVIRPEEYYLTVWKTFMQDEMAFPLLAEVEGEPIAGLFLFLFANRAWYLYGMSTQKHREKMPNHLLQWRAIQLAKERGCKNYDLWGAPDAFIEADPMWGVYKFKEGLGGKVVRTIGAWDFPVKPMTYKLFNSVLPKILAVTRSRRKQQTRQEVLE